MRLPFALLVLAACSASGTDDKGGPLTDRSALTLTTDTSGNEPGEPDVDADDDGYVATAAGGDDCDDTDDAIHPDAQEIWYDAVDQDCRGDDDFDQDADGYRDPSGGGDDCDDTRPAVHPDAFDPPYDGLDSDCGFDSDYDGDGDGADSDAFGGLDCDDADPLLNPSDGDGDGASPCDGDCDDADPLLSPGGVDVCEDAVDQDCSGRDAVCPVVDVGGRTYVLGWGEIVVSQPNAAGLIAAVDALLFETDVHDALAETLSWAGAAAIGAPPLADCATAIAFAPEDFSANPVFVMGPGTFQLTYAGTPIDIEDFVLSGSFDVDGGALLDLVLTGRIDTRPLDGLLGLDTCALVVGLGDTCTACADGQVECLEFAGTAATAAWDPAIDVIATCGL